MSNILNIYNTLIRIERNNHIAKRKSIYSKEQISGYYRLKAIELFYVIKRIDFTKPKCISYAVKEEIYRNIDCYLFTFNVLENKKYHIPNRIFQFHQPKYLFKGEKNMQYKSYQHIEKLGTIETEGILNGEVHLSYKIDGSNGCVYLKDTGELGFGSRKRDLSITEDNMGFMANFVCDKELYNRFLEILNNNPNYIIYGEWLVPVTIKRYEKDAWRKFYVFDVYNSLDGSYLPFNEYSKLLDKYNLLYIPEIAVLNNPTEEDIKAYLDRTGEFLITEGLGEGIVIKNYDYTNKYGRRTWAKILTEDFKKNKKEYREKNHIAKAEGNTELLIINAFLTPEHVLKEKHKIEENYGGWSSKNIKELLNRVYDEFLKDNFQIILKKFKDPTINFKLLRQCSNDFVKEVVGI